MEQLLAEGPSEPFSEAIFAPLAARFGILQEARPISCFLLNVAAADTRREAERQALDMRAAKKQIAAIQKQASVLAAELDALHPATAHVLNEASSARGVAQSFEGGGLDPDRAVEAAHEGLAALFEDASGGRAVVASCRTQLGDLEALLAVASRVAGAGKTGRPKDERLDLLIAAAFQVYEIFGGAQFTLEWHEKGEPISDAACFCREVVRVVAPDLPLSLIQTTSRRIRQTHRQVSDLDEALSLLATIAK